MTDDCKIILDFLNCDYELFENERDGAKICARREELWEQGKSENFTPLLIVVSDTLAEAIELFREDADLPLTPENAVRLREETLQRAKSVDVDRFLSERLEEYLEMHNDDDVMGTFRPCAPRDYLATIEFENETDEIILAKIPTTCPWELAAWVPMGGFNDCPAPAEQVAVFKRWYDEYGAVPDLVTYEVWEMELRGKKPISSDAEVEALAKQQFAFCYDIVMQASEEFASIRGLASQLKGSAVWYFWWD